MIKTYSWLLRFKTFDERFNYLKLGGGVGQSTFGFDRWLNQRFYRSREWLSARDHVIVRDNGCDLGVPGYEIRTELLIHHMNPMAVDDIVHAEEWITNPEYLITTSKRTHNSIHYGGDDPYPKTALARSPRDTTLW